MVTGTRTILRHSVFIIGLLITTIFIAQAQTTEPTNQSSAQSQLHWANENRASIIQSILNRVRAEAEAKEYIGWREELGAFLNELPAEQLLEAYHAQSFAEVVAAIRGHDPLEPQAFTANSEELSSNKLVGDSLQDLVFTPLTPCRIVDTRVSGGKFSAGQTRSYSVNDNTSSQGGASNCGVPDGANEPPAVVLNITSSGGEGNGFLTVWEIGATQPNASLLNYQTSDIANGSIVPTGLGQASEIQVFASSRTHVIIDVIGYLRKPGDCPSGQVVLGGLCYETALRSATTWQTAQNRCALAGGMLPEPGVLFTYRTGNLIAPTNSLTREWSNNAMAVGVSFVILHANAINRNGGVPFLLGTLIRHRCVFPRYR